MPDSQAEVRDHSPSLLRAFLVSEAAGGILLMIAAALARAGSASR